MNTASIAGLVVGPGSSSTYNVSKHGVVALSETLYYELAQRGAKVKVSILCPSWVNTRICDAERNRPIELRNDSRCCRQVAKPRNRGCRLIKLPTVCSKRSGTSSSIFSRIPKRKRGCVAKWSICSRSTIRRSPQYRVRTCSRDMSNGSQPVSAYQRETVGGTTACIWEPAICRNLHWAWRNLPTHRPYISLE